MTITRALAILCLLADVMACGGGGGSVSSGGGLSSGPPVIITTDATLPITVQGHSYTATLSATNGQGTLTWSIAPISPTTEFVDGLSINPQTGVLSGTANFGGTAGFVATVKDSAGHAATKTFTVTAYGVLQGGTRSANITEFESFGIIPVNVQGGVPPLTYSITGGSLPPGVRISDTLGQLVGGASALGSFHASVTIQDSFSPPQIATGQINVTVIPDALTIANSLPSKILLNRPFSGRVIATGGIPPYHFSNGPGGIGPPGLSSVDASGHISGTPTASGGYTVDVAASDSSTPRQTAHAYLTVSVQPPRGRNDTPATATPIDGLTSVTASISPYIDPPNGAPVPGDGDYYKLTSVSQAVVHVESHALPLFSGKNLLDTVLEIVDGNGIRFSTCRQPGDTAPNFNSACLNDDISASPHNTDSALDFQVPGAPSTPTTLYIHVLDWRGDARPEMQYILGVSGAVAPLALQTTSVLGAARGTNYFQQLSTLNGSAPVSWSVSSGSLPPGLMLNSMAGTITGVATVDGTYNFTLRAADASSPSQVVTVPMTIHVVEPVHITTSQNLPDACVNQPYSFTFHATGGLPPLRWGYTGLQPGIFLDQNTGVFSGTPPPSWVGTYTAMVGVNDGTTFGEGQTITFTVKNCP